MDKQEKETSFKNESERRMFILWKICLKLNCFFHRLGSLTVLLLLIFVTVCMFMNHV